MFASSALMDPISKGFVAGIHRFCGDGEIPMVDFAKGQRKDDLAHEYLAGFQAAGQTEGVLFVGRAQEKTRVFRTEKRRNPVTGALCALGVAGRGVEPGGDVVVLRLLAVRLDQVLARTIALAHGVLLEL
jgi:hypothetical protein